VEVFETKGHANLAELHEDETVPIRSKRALWVVTVMIGIAIVSIAVGTIYTLNAFLNREQNAFVKAQNDYANQKFASAAVQLNQLLEKFPDSNDAKFYRFLKDFCDVRDEVYGTAGEPRSAWDHMRRFLTQYQEERQLKEGYAQDVRESLFKLTEQLAGLALQEHDRTALAEANNALTGAIKFRTASSTVEEEQPLRQQIAAAETSMAAYEHRQQFLTWLRGQLAKGPPTAEQMKELRTEAKRQGFDNDAEVVVLLNQADEKIKELVQYVTQDRPLPRPALPESEPSLVPVATIVPPSGPPSAENRQVILALVRGLLFALDRDRGEVLWRTRVGVDSNTLPVRLPATPSSPELLLVLSADSKTLMALEAQKGILYWEHQLSAECLGRPVIVGKRAYVPTYDGRVHEIEIVDGNLLGYYDLRQPLTGGGVWQEGTDLIYMPADSDNVFILDTAQTSFPNQPSRRKECKGILRTGHPSGSLRSEPIIINRPDPFARDEVNQAASPSYLILSQSDGLQHMKLRVYTLPIQNFDAQPVLQPEPRVPGWSWFEPYHDGEKLAFVTDVGTLALFGINQVRNNDPPLFREELKVAFKPAAELTQPSLSRAQVVHAVENNFWILSNGYLQCVHYDLFTQQVVPLWPAPGLRLGSPVHASQVDETGKRLFLVTHDTDRQGYLVTAVEADRGRILWQRQLGVDCLGDPLVLGQQVLVSDRGGGLWRFSSSKAAPAPDQNKPRGDALVGKPLNLGPIVHFWLAAADGSRVYDASCLERGTQLFIRTYQSPLEGHSLQGELKQVELAAPLAGPPSLGPRTLLLPLADGTLRQLPLDLGGGAGAEGPPWRAARADEGAPGFVLHLEADDFITTDGSNGITHWIWPKDQPFAAIGMKEPTARLPARIIAPPVLVPRVNPGDEVRVCVADADNYVSLLTGPQLQNRSLWNVGGQISTGPFVRGQRIGCVVDRQRLVWIDPAQPKKVLWEYPFKGQQIVGQPQVVGGMVIVASEAGRFVGLDPDSGKPLGNGYTLKARAAPVATPVAYNADEAFVPLTDGSVFLLPLRDLHDAVAARR
jgi:outer membrane protein assembly factor BamB